MEFKHYNNFFWEMLKCELYSVNVVQVSVLWFCDDSNEMFGFDNNREFLDWLTSQERPCWFINWYHILWCPVLRTSWLCAAVCWRTYMVVVEWLSVGCSLLLQCVPALAVRLADFSASAWSSSQDTGLTICEPGSPGGSFPWCMCHMLHWDEYSLCNTM
jgi:hypothetical protein